VALFLPCGGYPSRVLFYKVGRRLRGVRSAVEPAIPKKLCPPGMNIENEEKKGKTFPQKNSSRPTQKPKSKLVLDVILPKAGCLHASRRQIGSLAKRLNIFVSQLRPLCRGTAPGGVDTTPGQEREVQKDGDPPNARIAAFHHPPLIPNLRPSLYHSARALQNSTQPPTRVCDPIRSKNTALGVCRTPGGMLEICFVL
jgi:hypothetical protein